MKSVFCLMYLFINMFGSVKLIPYHPTGHTQFNELRLVDDSKLILNDLSEMFIENELYFLPKKFWGTITEYHHEYEDATYVGAIVFSRSNKTNEAFIFDYSLTEVVYEETSFNIQGSVSLKASSKQKTVEGSGQIDIKASYSEKDSIQKTEKSAMKITVYPNKKITLRVAGEAKLTSGFSKSYMFYITTKKGAWESVDIVTSYFELVETDA